MLDVGFRVRAYPENQFVDGAVQQSSHHLPEAIYAAALDALVIVCVDVIPMHGDTILLSRRIRLPHSSWWINGGRMRKGELYGDAAARLMHTELGLLVDAARFRLLGFYNLLWDSRAHLPYGNGCQTLSVTFSVHLSTQEAAQVSPNDEYDATRWVTPGMILETAESQYHPALVAMIQDLWRYHVQGEIR